MIETIRIATRKSPLALAQTDLVAARLSTLYPALHIETVAITTEGDKKLDQSLAKIGGKGLFLKELEQALLDGRADIAVHSMKDVPVQQSKGLSIAAILPREDVRDVFVCNQMDALDQLPQGATIGTSSLRRQCQLKSYRPDFDIQFIRGNVNTRLHKLNEAKFDAIILAAAGLHRLDFHHHIKQYLPTAHFIPAVGQGAIGIECRTGELTDLLLPLNDLPTLTCLQAERAVSLTLNASCHTPLGVYAHITDDQLSINAMLGDVQHYKNIQCSLTGAIDQAEQLGQKIAEQLLQLGGKALLDNLE